MFEISGICERLGDKNSIHHGFADGKDCVFGER